MRKSMKMMKNPTGVPFYRMVCKESLKRNFQYLGSLFTNPIQNGREARSVGQCQLVLGHFASSLHYCTPMKCVGMFRALRIHSSSVERRSSAAAISGRLQE